MNTGIHPNSIKAIKVLKPGGTHNRILQIHHMMGRPLTDREVKEIGKYSDMNMCRPRLSELIEMGRLEECGSVKDVVTKKTVRLTRLKIQKDLFIKC